MRKAVKTALSATVVSLAAASCGRSEPLQIDTQDPGTLEVTTLTTGVTLDPDGYRVTLDEMLSQSIGINASIKFSGLTARTYNPTLTDVASNCEVTGENPKPISVTPGQTSRVEFDVECSS